MFLDPYGAPHLLGLLDPWDFSFFSFPYAFKLASSAEIALCRESFDNPLVLWLLGWCHVSGLLQSFEEHAR